MKNLFLPITVFSVLLLLSCQENSLTDPVIMDPVNKSQSQNGNISQGTFTLDGILLNPANVFNSYFTIEGRIDYIHELVLLDPLPPAPQSYVNLNLVVNAVLIDTDLPGHNTWIIGVESDDMLYVSEEGIYVLEKSFPAQGREDGLALVCRFLVSTDGVGFSGMWLSINSDIQIDETGTMTDMLTYPSKSIEVLE